MNIDKLDIARRRKHKIKVFKDYGSLEMTMPTFGAGGGRGGRFAKEPWMMDIKDKTSNDKIYKVQTSSQLAQVLEITKKIEPQKSYFNAQRIKDLA